MPIVNITLSNKNFTLFCNDGEEELLQNLSQSVNNKITSLKAANKSASFELLLVLTVLSLQQESQSLQGKLDKISDHSSIVEQEQFADTLSQIASYLEELARKMSQ